MRHPSKAAKENLTMAMSDGPMMKKAVATFCLLFAFIALIARQAATQSTHTAALPEQIGLHEAEILIYLIPQAQELRKQGMDIGWELETSPELNQQDFYTFWVVNSKRPNVQGSVTIGYFSVNKHTADVWDNDNEKIVSTAELEGIKKILRQAHHIDDLALRKFGSIRPNI
jgi:hypothetical protein